MSGRVRAAVEHFNDGDAFDSEASFDVVERAVATIALCLLIGAVLLVGLGFGAGWLVRGWLA